MHSDIQSLLLLLLQMLLLFNSWLLIQDALLENTSEITESTLLSSMTIFQSKPLLTDKCLFFWEDLLVEKLTQVMCSICIHVSWKEQLRWTWNMEVDLWQLFPLLKPKLVMCPLIFQPMSSQSLMDRSSWKLNSSIKVSDQPSMWVSLCPESDQPLKSKLWNKLPVPLNLSWLNTEKSLPSPNSDQILMLPLNIYSTEVRN